MNLGAVMCAYRVQSVPCMDRVTCWTREVEFRSGLTVPFFASVSIPATGRILSSDPFSTKMIFPMWPITSV
jgi:hypothetical protein